MGPPSGGRRWAQPCAGSDRIRHRRAWQHSVSCACNSAAPVGRGRRPGRCHEPGTPSQPHPARADGARQAGRRPRRISPATPHSCPGRRKRPCSRRSRMQGGRTVRPSSTPWGPARHGCFRTRPLMQIWAPRLTHSDMPSGTLSQVSQQTRRQTRIGTRRRSGGWLRKCVLLPQVAAAVEWSCTCARADTHTHTLTHSRRCVCVCVCTYTYMYVYM